MKLFHLIALFLLAQSSVSYAACKSWPEESPTFKFGMSTAVSGPAQYIGLSMRAGFLSYFEEANCKGSLPAKLELIVRDDGYQPKSALNNVEKLVLEDDVLALVGNVGTPTAKFTAPFAQQHGKVFYAAYTGASLLRLDPPEEYIFNFRASYQQELEAIIHYILSVGVKPGRIAFFIQDDAYGNSGYESAMTVLELMDFKNARELVVTKYPRNSLQVEDAIIEILEMPKPPQAIILVGAYAPSAKFINYSHNLLPTTRYFNLSFSGATSLANSLDISSNRVFVSQVVPYLGNGLVLSSEFKETMHRHGFAEQINEISFEGYIAAKMLVLALQNLQVNATSDDLKAALTNLADVDVGLGATLSFSEEDHQASDSVWLLQYQKGQGFSQKVQVQKHDH